MGFPKALRISEREWQLSFMNKRPAKLIASVMKSLDVPADADWFFHETEEAGNGRFSDIAKCCVNPKMGTMWSNSDLYGRSLFYFLRCESCKSIHWWGTIERLNNALKIDHSEEGDG